MATASEKRAKAVQYMTDREKKNSYTQNYPKRTYFFGYPDNKPGNKTQKGYSDCSAAAMKAIKAAAGISIGANTTEQINNRKKGKIVDETTGYYPDESKLLPGDCLYFKGNTSHPLDVGHVEVYIGNGRCVGHGSGTGPTIKNLKTYCKGRATSKRRYFMAIRWILGDDDPVVAPEKDLSSVALEVLNGKWDNGSARKQKLIAAGYDYTEVQAAVNALLNPKPVQKSLTEVAREVINGEWGNGKERKARLEAAGYTYALVQEKVNSLLREK